MRLPYDTSVLDPYDLSDPMAAIVGSAVFEPLYRLSAQGLPYASLADGLPQQQGGVTRVWLRKGLRSALGRPLDARDVVHSVQRARAGGAAGLLANIPTPRVDRADARACVFGQVEPQLLAQVLASPLLALSSRQSTPAQPDGTGAFRAEPSPQRLLLRRNEHAARGPGLLDRIIVQRATTLAEPLRAFEAHQTDVGWHGAGLHQQLADARPFDFGMAAWVVLHTGQQLGSWNAPGVAQRLLDGIPRARLAHLALELTDSQAPSQPYAGPPCDLLVPSESAHLVEVARTLASILSSPGHEITVTPVSQTEVRRAVQKHDFGMLVNLVRPVGPPGLATLVALATADSPDDGRSSGRHPPRLSQYAPQVLARTLRLGVVGHIKVRGAATPSVRLVGQPGSDGWDLGGAYRIER